MESGLIFAPLVRVSTEKQAKRGESLNTQRKQLQATIDHLNGTIYQWYSGQEHATVNEERIILNQLLMDAAQNKFNAVIVADISRWSRDNHKNKESLEILKKHRIRFFDRTREYNLFDATESFMIGMGVEVSEYFSKLQAEKSLQNRIEVAKKGMPAAGRFPYGRKYIKESNQWIVDPEKKKKVEEMANAYLNENLSFIGLSKRFGMEQSQIHSILLKRSGAKWKQCFHNKEKGTTETIIINIPPLLSDNVIERIKIKSEARRTYEHASQKYEYLFSRIIYDADTGEALTGSANEKGMRYYRPYKNRAYSINAECLEIQVVDGFIEMLSRDDHFYNAVFDGGNQNDKRQELAKDKLVKELEMKKILKLLSHKKTAIDEFNGNEDDFVNFIGLLKPEIKDLEERVKTLDSAIQSIENQINTLPTPEEIEATRTWVNIQIAQRTHEGYLTSGGAFNDLPFKDKKRLINLIFGGKDENGKKYGIYVKLKNGESQRKRVYIFEAYGKLGSIKGSLETGQFSDIELNGEIFPVGTDEKMINEIAHIFNNFYPEFKNYYALYKNIPPPTERKIHKEHLKNIIDRQPVGRIL